MMKLKTCWEELGISPTTDKKIIRQAYARKSSECHPEEHPEEFRRLHDAYEAALDAAKHGGGQNSYGHSGSASGTSDGADTGTSANTGTSGDTGAPPDIEQLILQGMEKDAAGRVDHLMGKIRFIHEHMPSGVDIYTSNMHRAMDRWDELFQSELFFRCQWQADFLSALTGWLNEHLEELNRAEVISFYRVYHLERLPEEDVLPPDVSEPLASLREMILSLTGKYGPDLISYAGMPAPAASYSGPDPATELERKQKRRNFLLCGFCILLLLLVTMPLYLSRKLFSREAVVPEAYTTAYHLNRTASPWQSDDLFTRAFPDGYPLTESEEKSGKIAEGDQLLIDIYLLENRQPDAMVDCIQEATMKQPAIYQITRGGIPEITREGTPEITYRLYIEKTGTNPSTYRLLASTYIPEIFLAFARQNQVPGKVWVDDEYEVHLALKWGQLEDHTGLDKTLANIFNQFSTYRLKEGWNFNLPAVNVTVVYGDVDLDLLASGKYMSSGEATELPKTYICFSSTGISRLLSPD
ncbi:hypothetical protein [Clostridium sp. AN503]|uniref:hypothetical protein n=1 Tax=Clostridium sp. AN503 TaxID=3160598 RepID=UPI0034575A79